MAIEVEHDPETKRFFAHTEHGVARLDYERTGESKLDYTHTFVPEKDRGQGIASRLVEHAFRYAAEHDHLVIPSCPFVRSWLEKNRRYQGQAVRR